MNFLPQNKVAHISNLKPFAKNKLDVAQVIEFVFERIENLVAKGENAGYHHFILFPQFFQMSSSLG